MANTASCCDTCTFYIYDDEYECYTCDRDLDEDEMMRFLTDQNYQCPYSSPYLRSEMESQLP